MRSGCHDINRERSAIFKRLVIEDCEAIWPLQAARTAWQGFPPISQAKLLVILLSNRTRNEQQLWEEEVPARSEEEFTTVGLARPNSQQNFPWQGGKRQDFEQRAELLNKSPRFWAKSSTFGQSARILSKAWSFWKKSEVFRKSANFSEGALFEKCAIFLYCLW
jgi:hypothetical protein